MARVSSKYSNIEIVEYSTILMLDYYKDTLENVGLPEALLEWDSNYVTRIENKYIKCELNQIRKS